MTVNNKPKIGAILLAAGGSTRLGRSKQLLKFEGEPLVKRATRILVESVYFPVVVVLGKGAEMVAAELEGLPVYTQINESWSEGMSSSIKSGLERILTIEPDLDALLISLCDQPKIPVEIMNRFVERYSETASPIIAAGYEGVCGVPALFAKEMFPQLSRLDGDKGARQLIRGCTATETIDLPEAAFDVDTAADAGRLGRQV